jgi:hypothetical protein
LSDYSHKHEEWLAELKACVKKKSYNTHQTQMHNSQQYTHSTSGRETGTEKEKEKKKEQKTIGFTTTDNKFTTSNLLSLMIKYKKDTLNSFGHKGIEEIAKYYNISIAQVNQVYNNLITMEKYSESTMNELVIGYVNELVVDGKNAIKTNKIGNTMLLQICEDIMARPCVISEVIDDLLTKAGSSNG